MKGKRGRKKARRLSARDDEELSDEPVYCICRSSQCDSFMIACDACEEWFHGECINVTPKQADCIQKFYCQQCRDDKPELRIEFKSDHSNGRQRHGSRKRSSGMTSPATGQANDYTDVFDNSLSRKRNRRQSQPAQPKARRNTAALPQRTGGSSDDEFDLGNSQFASPSSSYSHSHAGSYSQRSKYGRTTPPSSFDNHFESELQPAWRRPLVKGRFRQPCGECDNCKTKPNCGSCTVCRSPKFKEGRSRQHCLFKTKICQSNDQEYEQPWNRQPHRGRYPPPCGECENCKTKENCGTCEVCRSPKFKVGRSRLHCSYKAAICTTSEAQRNAVRLSPPQGSFSDLDYATQFDDVAPKRSLLTSQKGGISIGSKMRRGDHLPGGLAPSSRHILDRGFDPQFSRRGLYNDMQFLDGSEFSSPYGMPPTHRNGASRYGSMSRSSNINRSVLQHTGGVLDGVDPVEHSDGPQNYDSEDDMVLSDLRPCAGPACSKPAIRTRYCSEECQLRHESESANRGSAASRFSISKEQITTPYNLEYSDHLYCRHHRMHDPRGFNMESVVNVSQGSSGVSDAFSDMYTPFINTNPSTGLDYVFDPIGTTGAVPASYRRITGNLPASSSTGDDFFSFPKVGTPRISRQSMSSTPDYHRIGNRLRGGPTQVPISTESSVELLSPPVPLDAITPTVHPIRMFNGHLATSAADFRVSTAEGEAAAAAELLATDANDLLNVDGNSSSDVGGAGTGSTNAGQPGNSAAFRQGDEYYMMNENENIEINWPTSPSGIATASAGTV